MYSTLNEFKIYLWITDDSRNTELTMFLQSANGTLNKLLRVDSFEAWEKTENVKRILQDWNNVCIFTKNRPVEQILEIGGETYHGTNWSDFIVLCDRKVVFKWSSILNKINDFGVLTVKYKYWYSVIPPELKQLEMMLASWYVQQKGNEGVSSYKLWDEQITFGNRNGQTADEMYFSFKTLLNKRQNFILPC